MTDHTDDITLSTEQVSHFNILQEQAQTCTELTTFILNTTKVKSKVKLGYIVVRSKA